MRQRSTMLAVTCGAECGAKVTSRNVPVRARTPPMGKAKTLDIQTTIEQELYEALKFVCIMTQNFYLKLLTHHTTLNYSIKHDGRAYPVHQRLVESL